MSTIFDLITSASSNLSSLTNNIITPPSNIISSLPANNISTLQNNTKIALSTNVYTEEEEGNIYSRLQLKGAGKTIHKKVKKSVPKKKQIDTYTKDKLVKIAKKYDIKLSSKGVKRTKEQLFNSLKRKKLI